MDTFTTASKIAPVDYDVHELIQQRWSPRAFSEEPVTNNLLRQLFEAARWAPSSFNEQPWRFIVATYKEPEEYGRMAQLLNDFNRTWAADAPVLVLAVAKDRFVMDGRTNPHAAYNLRQAVAQLTLEATRHDLGVHQMAGFDVEKIRDVFSIPQGFTPCTMMALGYPREPDALPESLQKKELAPRKRLDLDAIAFRRRWTHRKAI